MPIPKTTKPSPKQILPYDPELNTAFKLYNKKHDNIIKKNTKNNIKAGSIVEKTIHAIVTRGTALAPKVCDLNLSNTIEVIIAYSWVNKKGNKIEANKKKIQDTTMFGIKLTKKPTLPPCINDTFPNLTTILDDTESVQLKDNIKTTQTAEYELLFDKYLNLSKCITEINKTKENQEQKRDTTIEFQTAYDTMNKTGQHKPFTILDVTDKGCDTNSFEITNKDTKLTTNTQTFTLTCTEMSTTYTIKITQTTIALHITHPPVEWNVPDYNKPINTKQWLTQTTRIEDNISDDSPALIITAVNNMTSSEFPKSGTVSYSFGSKTPHVQVLPTSQIITMPTTYDNLQRQSIQNIINMDFPLQIDKEKGKYRNLISYIQPLTQHSIFTPGLICLICAGGNNKKTSDSDISTTVDQVYIYAHWNEMPSTKTMQPFMGIAPPTPLNDYEMQHIMRLAALPSAFDNE